MCVCVCVCVGVGLCIYIFVYIFVYIYIYVCTLVCVCVCVYIYIQRERERAPPQKRRSDASAMRHPPRSDRTRSPSVAWPFSLRMPFMRKTYVADASSSTPFCVSSSTSLLVRDSMMIEASVAANSSPADACIRQHTSAYV